MEKSISRQIAEFAVALRYEDLPENVRYEIKRYLYDSFGCALGSMHTRDVNAIHDIYSEMGGREEATVIGFRTRMPAVNAAFVNALMIRSLDFNDIYWKQDPSHPSDIIPAALAMGERVGASMKTVMTAIVLAYEFEQRMCEFARPGVRERKWHHATLTQFVSPLVAGKVLGLNADQMVNAVGISACHNHTIGCPTAGKLTMMKNTVDPMATQSGVLAALMAQKGYTGTEAIFEGKEGLMDVFGPDWDTGALLGDLGKSFKILECSMKAFPTEALTHTHISAAIKIVSENDIDYRDIASVTITTIARACDILFDPHKYRPDSRETADHSLPYCIACALVDRKVTTQSFDDERIYDPRIREVIDKIHGEASEEFEKMFPAKQPSRVRIRLKNGKEYSVYLEYPKGDPREPMTEADLDAKVSALCADRYDANKLKDILFRCDTMSTREMMEKL
ncbi:MAG: MmgE/PrpD family protein [Candidatus Marinimicrobia bacterium]|nr:MmgE/PrpD family protein [Candidatus Neomarinimicrobiota bacterium]MDD4962007.1 MmgE/PrpD family protein [Candidatus Neomarinimicrobiota bacterium]MDD5708957.1 MmgE/PrpD family protein [Candidatus Neomarinimicrobiota bacterium]MDX9777954.1 MmgE/PrpD family protein [bacterium]